MPRFDGTGPRGLGPRTGGGRGFCPPIWPGVSPYRPAPWAGYPMAGQWPTPQAQAYWQAMQAGQAPSLSYGGAWGTSSYGGQTAPGVFAPGMTREQELDFIKNQAQMLEGQLEQIEARMRELETKE